MTLQRDLPNILPRWAGALGNGNRLAMLEHHVGSLLRHVAPCRPARLRLLDYHFMRFEKNYPAWKAAGLPVTSSAAPT